MKILFLHKTFPSQFLHLVSYFIRRGHEVRFLATVIGEGEKENLEGMEPELFALPKGAAENLPSELKQMEAAARHGRAAAEALSALMASGFTPELIIGHADWGLLLYLKPVCPQAFFAGYFEWYPRGWNLKMIDPDAKEPSFSSRWAYFTGGAAELLSFQACDACFCPMEWQRAQFPAEYRPRLQVLHEGVDAGAFAAASRHQGFSLPRVGCRVPPGVPLITYVSRGLEPLRGFGDFMAAVRVLLSRRADCHVIIVGKDASYYGRPPEDESHKTWKQVEDDKGSLDYARIHFTGRLQREDYQRVLSASWVHVYLSRPFVLSWSLLEAMAAGCAIVAAKTPPVQEVMEDGVQGLLTEAGNPEAVAACIERALDPGLGERLGKAARQRILERYDSQACAARQAEWLLAAAGEKREEG